MAQEMDDLEFLLPSELLTDDDLLSDFGCGLESSCGLSSDLSSPVESVTGTTETAGDEDDFISELTRKLTHSKLSYEYPAKSVKQSSSPQSTLSGLKTGSLGSPNSDYRVFSPPDAKDSLSWDMLYAAAEEAARIRMVEEAAAFYTSELFGPARKLNPAAGYFPNQAETHASHSYQQLQGAKMKQHQLIMKNRVMSQGNVDYLLKTGRRDGGADGAYGLSMSAWPTLQQSQQKSGAGMKPVFPGEPGPVKERVGTGVFMPRRFGPIPTEARKKPAVHSLNTDSIDFHQHPFGNFTAESDAVLKLSNDLKMAQNQGGRNNLRPPPLMKQELMLPPEWTY